MELLKELGTEYSRLLRGVSDLILNKMILVQAPKASFWGPPAAVRVWIKSLRCWACPSDGHVRWIRLREHINHHLVRFILPGLATGSRKSVIHGARWMPNIHAGWVDIDKGLFHRRAPDEIETKKRKPPSALGPHIMVHLRRWKRFDDERRARHVAAGGSTLDYQTIVHRRGKEIGDIKTAWAAACGLAYLPVGNDGFARHTMRHTLATMLMRKGVDIWQAAGQLGMSPKLMQDRHGHHSPHFQAEAKNVR